jgi:hypothetical protein
MKISEHLKHVASTILMKLRQYEHVYKNSIEQLKSDIEEELNSNFYFEDERRKLYEEERDILKEEIYNYCLIEFTLNDDLVDIKRGVIISDKDPSIHTKWEPDQKRIFWTKQKQFLVQTFEKKMPSHKYGQIINSINHETEQILEAIENPLRDEFDSRGLVLGYVQSGKTANFTALIAKAADAGYRLIIVLAGIHDELRQQTQIRIDKELTGYNPLKLDSKFVSWSAFEEKNRWKNITTAGWIDENENGEFNIHRVHPFKDELLSKERPAIAIVKKNVKILKKIVKWIKDAPIEFRNTIPLLVIDDEADQASVDGNANKSDTDPTKTNSSIREILNLFKRKSYVGYTATPFANVFIDRTSNHSEYGEDLFPRNFIYALPEPEGYFGTRKIFSDELDKYFVVNIKSPLIEKKEILTNNNVTDDLFNAVYDFLIGIALRILRGDSNAPMSMMINLDHRVAKMNTCSEVVKEFVQNITQFKKFNSDELIDKYIERSKKLNSYLDTQNAYFPNEQIKNTVIEFLNSNTLKVITLNSSKDDKLDYANNPSMKVIAIGGNKLSRGLTLEGLMITYYLREAKQYDTSLQMGRWFGYREKYEDLVRIYTSKSLWQQFKDLSIVELEFRKDIEEMNISDSTPNEFAIGVKHILGLLPTAKNKLGASIFEESLGAKQVSMTKLPLDYPEKIDANYKVFENFIKYNEEKFSRFNDSDNPTLLGKEIAINDVLKFIQSFEYAQGKNKQFLDIDKNKLSDYINNNKESLSYWNVAIPSLSESPDNLVISVGKFKIKAIHRSRMNNFSDNGNYNIKGLSDKKDRRIDLSKDAKDEFDGRTKPLLLIYFISKNSKASLNSKGVRADLYDGIEISKHRNPIAFSIIFPRNNEVSSRYIQPINNIMNEN